MRNGMKKFLSTLVICAMGISLIACGSKGNGEKKDSEGKNTTIKFQQWWGVELPEGYLDKVAKDFEKDTGIKVELISAPWADTKTAITAGATNKTIADVVSVDGAWLAEFADMGILADVEEAGVKTDLANDVWKLDGKSYVVPVNNFAYPLYANMDILEKAGVTEIPQTWSEFTEACKKVKEAGYSAFALNLGTTNANGIQNVFMGTGWGSGIALKNEDGKYAVEGNQELKELAEFFKALNEAGVLYPGMATLEESEMTSNFAAGNCAFTLASAATMSNFEKLNFKAVTVPVKDGYEGEKGICYASWAVGISEASENKEAAAKFINYLLGGKDGKDGTVSAGLASTMSAFPNSKIAEPDYSDAPEQFREFYEEYKKGHVINEFIGLPNASSVMTSMTNDLVKYLDGDMETDTMLTNWQKYLEEAGK